MAIVAEWGGGGSLGGLPLLRGGDRAPARAAEREAFQGLSVMDLPEEALRAHHARGYMLDGVPVAFHLLARPGARGPLRFRRG